MKNGSITKTWLGRSLTFLAVMAMMTLVLLGTGGTAQAGKLPPSPTPSPLPPKIITVKAATLTDHANDCKIGQLSAHFVITQIASLTQVPASISVTWSDGTNTVTHATVPLDIGDNGLPKYTGGTAHYTDAAPGAAYKVTVASTTIYGAWAGEFNLSNYNCLQVAVTIGPSATNLISRALDTETGLPTVDENGQFNYQGAEHTFTVNVTSNGTLSNPVNITVTVNPTPTSGPTGCGNVAPATASTATCTATINSDVVQTYLASATATGTLNGVAFTVSTGTTFETGAAKKSYACATVTLYFEMSRPANWGSVQAFWQSTTPTALTTSNTTAPYIYKGSITVAGPTATGGWSAQVLAGTTVVYDTGLQDGGTPATETTPAIPALTIGGTGSDCDELVQLSSPVGDVSVRKFNDENADSADPIYVDGLPSEAGVAGATISACLWIDSACFAGTTQSGVTSIDNDYTIQFGGLVGPWKIWETAPAGWEQTYPIVGSVATDCGALANTCTAGDGIWLLSLQASGSTTLDIGNHLIPTEGTCWCSPGFWKNNTAPWALTGYSPTAGFNTTFGVTAAASHVDDATTLQQAAGLTGGDYGKLARFAVAALAIAGCQLDAQDGVTVCHGGLFGSPSTVISTYVQALADQNWGAQETSYATGTEPCPIDANGNIVDALK